MNPRSLRLIRIGLILPTALAAGAAYATNEGKPRVPVIWPADSPCMTVVDRSLNPIVHIPYTFGGADDVPGPENVGIDEVQDSRRHQFFAFCRQRTRIELLPRWLNQQDVTAWQNLNQPGPPLPTQPEEFLDSHPDWQDCVFRINADDDRRPIMHIIADAGIDWDTSLVPQGVYSIDAYTWEPPINIWADKPRPAVVKVVDYIDPSQNPPAASITTGSSFAYRNQPIPIEGCVSAAPGSQLDAYWAVLPNPTTSPPQWQSWHNSIPVESEQFQFEFMAPPEVLVGTSVKFLIRVDVRDPFQRSYTSYMYDELAVLSIDAPTEGTTSTTTGSDPLNPEDDSSDDLSNCSISTNDPFNSLYGGVLIPLLLVFNRRPYRQRHT